MADTHPVPNNGLGRPVGAINRANRRLKVELEGFFTSAEYKASLYRRIIAGTAPTVEIYLLQMLYGKPREHVDVTVSQSEEDLSKLSLEELMQRSEEMVSQLREVQELKAAIPAEFRTVLGVESIEAAEKPAEPGSLMSEGAETPAEQSMDGPDVDSRR